MDLTATYPRSPNDTMAGIVSLPRMIDKTRADAEGTLGEYDVDCPHDKPVLEFLGVDFPTFAEKLQSLDYADPAIEHWARGLLAKRHTPEEIAAFNEARRHWGPNESTAKFFDMMRDRVAPGRSDVKTWFQLLDLDEKRPA